MTSHLQYLTTAEGRIAYELFEPPSGGGRGLVVTIPGMGDLRSTYRFLVPALVDAGIRVAATDLRGHGDSDATFQRYGDAETARTSSRSSRRCGPRRASSSRATG